jgi:catechol-2,3-dioxygenase
MRRPGALIEGICELTLEARDPAALERFYRDVLGFEPLAREDDRIWLACGERARLGLWTRGRKEFGDRGGAHVHFALACPPQGIERVRARLDELGVRYQGPIEHDGGDRSLYLEDPERNVLEVWDFFERGRGAREGVDALRAR